MINHDQLQYILHFTCCFSTPVMKAAGHHYAFNECKNPLINHDLLQLIMINHDYSSLIEINHNVLWLIHHYHVIEQNIILTYFLKWSVIGNFCSIQQGSNVISFHVAQNSWQRPCFYLLFKKKELVINKSRRGNNKWIKQYLDCNFLLLWKLRSFVQSVL